MTFVLNPQQDAAVRHVAGPLLVLAGAGSGKTGVITRKIAWLIAQQQMLPEKIAAITFTNKAAREMRHRLSDLLGKEIASQLLVCTFHSLGLKIMLAEAKRLGYRSGFSIFDTQDSKAIIQELLPGGSSPDATDRVRWQISRWKSDGLTPDQIDDHPEMVAVYEGYQQQLLKFNAMDFDDLISLPVRLLESDESVRLSWQQKIRYLLVDEYQDTNAIQYRMLRQLLDQRAMITAVGDDDQSIYGWRGARPENIDQFGVDFEQLKIIKLEQNYRSSRTILKAANALISHNPHTIDKQLWSDLGDGDPIRVLICRDAQHEAERVVSSILEKRFIGKNDCGDFAVLYRSNHQSRVLEQALRAHRIPYQLSGARSFFDRSEIKDVLTYLRLVVNPNDDSAFLRVINTPRRSLGASTIGHIATHAERFDCSMMTAARSLACQSGLPGRALIVLKRFLEWLDGLSRHSEGQSAAMLAARIIEDTDYEDWLLKSSRDAVQAERRIEAVADLMKWLKGMDQGLSLSESLQQLALSNQDDDEPSEEAVHLMTLHAAKGLEFPHVYMVGVESGILPHQNSIDEGTLEEERRLMYVGVTRAQRTLCLSYSRHRRRFGETEKAEPSPFLEEMPAELMHWEGRDTESDEAASRKTASAHLADMKAMFDD